MAYTPFGYRIQGGKAIIDKAAAEQVRQLYQNYLNGMSMVAAAKAAGIDTYHGTVKRMMENRHYMGDDFYPAIIDVDTFTEAMLERQRRAKKLGRTNRIKPPVKKTSPTTFTLGTIKEFYDDPAKQAEYLYSLIESEAK